MEPMEIKKIGDIKTISNKANGNERKKKREQRDSQYPSRALLPETLPLLYKKWEIANSDGGNVVKQKHIIHRAVELISTDELKGLRNNLVTPKIQFNERYLKWRGDDASRTIDDFKAYLLELMEMNAEGEPSNAIDIPDPFAK